MTSRSLALSLPAPQVQLHGIVGIDDERLVELWLHGRSRHTQRAYRLEATRFLDFVTAQGRTLRSTTLTDLQRYADSLTGAPASRTRALSAVKSLLSYGMRVGYLPMNVGAALRLKSPEQTLAERILTEAQIHAMFTLEPNPRNRLLMRLMYAAGLRVSELAGIRWRHLQPRDQGGQVSIMGKGSKRRSILLPASIWRELDAARPEESQPDDPVFRSRSLGGPLTPNGVERIVIAAGRRAGIQARVTPHWLRHAHATHALERGAPIHLVQATLGHVNVATTGRYLHARPTDSSARYLAL